MTSIAQELDKHLLHWPEDTRLLIETMVADLIHWGEAGAADLTRGREVEQEVLDSLDAP
jgi:hypothetical protein